MTYHAIRSFLASSLLRYVSVGAANTAVGLSVSLLLLNALGCSYWAATAAGTSAGVALSYVLNRRYTFRSTVSVAGSLPRFLLVSLLCYGLSYGCSRPLAELLSSLIRVSDSALAAISAHNAAVLLGSVMYTGLGYAGHRCWTFRSNDTPQGGTSYRHETPDPT